MYPKVGNTHPWRAFGVIQGSVIACSTIWGEALSDWLIKKADFHESMKCFFFFSSEKNKGRLLKSVNLCVIESRQKKNIKKTDLGKTILDVV